MEEMQTPVGITLDGGGAYFKGPSGRSIELRIKINDEIEVYREDSETPGLMLYVGLMSELYEAGTLPRAIRMVAMYFRAARAAEIAKSEAISALHFGDWRVVR